MNIKLSNNQEYELKNIGVIFPGAGANGRNKMELHFDIGAMSSAVFEALAKTKENFAEVHLVQGENDMVYSHYQDLIAFGQKMFSETDNASGAVIKEMRYVIELEQYTPIERQLMALGISV